MQSIQYLLHQQVDKKKWNDCIASAANGLLYVCSGYLDAMAEDWDALVLNDYEMVMPLPHRKKFGINYLFQPSITPSLGVFGNNVNGKVISLFIKAIPTKFKVWDISFNNSNKVTHDKGIIISRNNYVLNLADTYDTINQHYSENIQRNIAKAIKSNCVVKRDIGFDEVAAVCKKEFPKFTTVEDGLFEKLHNVYNTYREQAVTYAVFTESGVLLASCIFLFFKNRAYYWLVGNTPESKQFGASSLLMDSFIKDHAGKNLILDFEGSDTNSVADFYRKFGAVLEFYSTLYVNKLPFPFNLLKPLPVYYRNLISK